MKKKIGSLIPVLLSLAILAGCSETQESSAEMSSKTTTTNVTEAATAQTEAAMDIGTINGDGTRTITDMAGRTVTIPVDVERVYCAVPTAEAMMCTLIPEKLVGWVNTPSDEMKKYLNESVADLPVVGGWMGQKVTANMEDIISIKPDVIVYMTTNSVAPVGEDTADSIQEQTGSPVFVVNCCLENTGYVYRLLGELLGVSERGRLLGDYCDEKLAEVKSFVSAVPEDKKTTIYYAEAADGLSTDPAGSGHTEVLDLVGVKNIADVEMLGGMGMTEVSIEQVINWNPEVILVSGSAAGTKESIETSGIWDDIKAVKDGEIYTTPVYPFNWFDRPPNIMRVLGCVWFSELIYPDYCDFDVDKEIKDFFSLFYNVELTDDQIKALSGL